MMVDGWMVSHVTHWPAAGGGVSSNREAKTGLCRRGEGGNQRLERCLPVPRRSIPSSSSSRLGNKGEQSFLGGSVDSPPSSVSHRGQARERSAVPAPSTSTWGWPVLCISKPTAPAALCEFPLESPAPHTGVQTSVLQIRKH